MVILYRGQHANDELSIYTLVEFICLLNWFNY